MSEAASGNRIISRPQRYPQFPGDPQAFERLASTLDSLGDGLIGTDLCGNIDLFNAMAEQLTGWGAAEAIGQPLARIFRLVHAQTRDPMPDPVARALQTGNVIGLANQSMLVARDGSQHFISASVAPIRNGARILGVVITFRDVSRHKQTEQALRTSEARNRALLQTIPDELVRFNRAGDYLDIQFASSFDSPLAEVDWRGRNVKDLWPEEVAQGLLQGIERALTTRSIQVFKYRVHCHGVECYREARIVPSDADEVLTLVRDITEHEQVEARQRQQAEQERLLSSIALRIRRSLNLERILETAAAEVRQFLRVDRVLIYAFQGSSTSRVIAEAVSPDWDSVVGYTLSGKDLQEYRQLYWRGQARANSDLDRAEGIPVILREHLRQMQVQADMAVPLFQAGRLWGLLVAHQCSGPRQWQEEEIALSQRLATQIEIAIQQAQLYEQVRQSNDDLERQVRVRTAQLNKQLTALQLQAQLLDTVESAVVATDATGRILYWNAYAQRLYRFSQQAALGEPIVNVIPFSPGQSRALMAALARGERWATELEMGRDPAMSILIKHIPTYGPSGQLHGSIGISMEITERKQAELELHRQMRELQQLNVLKDDFLSTVSHELRTPMANIRMAIHMLKTSLGSTAEPPCPKVQRYLGILHEECLRETELINDLLDLQRLESGSQRFEYEWICPQEWILGETKPFYMRAQQRKLHLQVNVAANLPPLWADRSCLGRILAELLNNACKYSPPQAEIRVSLSICDNSLLLTVANSGTEIPIAEQERIFTKFYRIPDGDRWKQGGTGLGLALIKHMVEQMQGQIGLRSQLGWTVFWVKLPLKDPPP